MNSIHQDISNLLEVLEKLISGYSVDKNLYYNLIHKIKFKLVLNDLVIITRISNEREIFCTNCQDFIDEDEKIVKYILFHKCNFCTEYCRQEYEDYSRKSWRLDKKEWKKNKNS